MRITVIKTFSAFKAIFSLLPLSLSLSLSCPPRSTFEFGIQSDEFPKVCSFGNLLKSWLVQIDHDNRVTETD